MPWWKEELLARLEEGPLTSEQIGEILGCYGPDAVCRARTAGVRLMIVDYVRGPNPYKRYKRNLYGVIPWEKDDNF